MTRSSIHISLMLILCILVPLALAACGSAEDTALITSYTALMQAINEAKDGDVLLVGDIDFLPTSPDIVHSYMCIEIDRSITIRSGKRDGAAVFTNGAFKLVGSKVSGEGTVCSFEQIIFDGCADTAALVSADFDYPWSEAEQTYTMYVPHGAQQALAFSGNVSAAFTGCSFRNYMHEYGPVIDIRYGDYTDNAYLLDLWGDYSGCKLDLTFTDCRIEDNAAFYDGGAIYIESNKNVTLTARDCIISGNRSGRGEFRRGGGAIYAEGAALALTRCTIEGNIGNHSYPGLALPETDTNRGGALQLAGGSLRLIDSTLSGNRASLGGGLSLTDNKADIDGCTFTGNRAEAESLNPYGTTGPWSNMAQGGAIYVEGMNGSTIALTNCTIEHNSAATAYGGIYAYYAGFVNPDDPSYRLNLTLCTYQNNTVDAAYTYPVDPKYLWFSHPGDITENPDMTLFGCLFCDESFAADFPHDEQPTAENGYNRIAAVADDAASAIRIPADAAEKALGGRYGEKLRKVTVGANYAASLYREPRELAWLPWSAAAGALLLLIVGIALLRRRARKAAAGDNAPTPIPAAEAPAPKQIVMTRYDDAEIDRFLSLVPETQRLTGRELEVLREILRGRKQGEVAYYLGIEVSTVKDFYRKIYDKLEVPNKDGLFRFATDILSAK